MFAARIWDAEALDIAHLRQQSNHSDPQKLLTRQAGGSPGSTEKEQEG
jgi:hypothetical protein